MAKDLSADLDRMDWSADPLDRLAELRIIRERLDFMVEQAVAECRAGGMTPFQDDIEGESSREGQSFAPVSWARIGDALNISRQGARQRYDGIEVYG
jgi:hypothetical protein